MHGVGGRRALQAAPGRSDVLTNYGIFLEEIRQDIEAAEQCYRRAADGEESDLVALCHCGGLLLRQVLSLPSAGPLIFGGVGAAAVRIARNENPEDGGY